MADLIYLSFRDMAHAAAGPVFPAQVMRAKGVGQDYDWAGPDALQRIRDRDLDLVPWDETAAIFARKDVYFLIHGFNVSRDRGFMGTGAAAQEILGEGVEDGAIALAGGKMIVPVLWPGDWYVPGINYPFEFGDARETARQFVKFLLSSATRIARASFITHSFGVRVALETMRMTLEAGRPDVAPAFGSALFMAAADDDDVIDWDYYGAVFDALQNVTVLSSESDATLRNAFPFGDAAEAALWDNQRTFRPALGLSGPRMLAESGFRGKTVWRPIPDAARTDHGDYLPQPWTKDASAKNGWTDKRRKVLKLMRQACAGVTEEWPATAEPRTLPAKSPSDAAS